MLNRKSFFVIFVFLLGFSLLIFNYIIGAEKIIDAAANEFRGGSCGACFSCSLREICSKRYGFDLYLLALTPFFLASLVSFFGTIILDNNLISNLKLSFVICFFWVAILESLIGIFQTPVLSTSFLEGRQELKYSFLLSHICWQQLVIISIGIFLSSTISYFFAGFIKTLRKKLFKKSNR